MKRRHSGHMQGGMNNNRRPQGKFSSGNFQRPRKNYQALREKYLNMAKDAMSGGDRVLAEYYLQHSEHYFRMQQEFLAERAARQQNAAPEAQGEDNVDEMSDEEEGEVNIPNNSNVLPAFLTRQPSAEQQQAAKEPAWEEE